MSKILNFIKTRKTLENDVPHQIEKKIVKKDKKPQKIFRYFWLPICILLCLRTVFESVKFWKPWRVRPIKLLREITKNCRKENCHGKFSKCEKGKQTTFSYTIWRVKCSVQCNFLTVHRSFPSDVLKLEQSGEEKFPCVKDCVFCVKIETRKWCDLTNAMDHGFFFFYWIWNI